MMPQSGKFHTEGRARGRERPSYKRAASLTNHNKQITLAQELDFNRGYNGVGGVYS